MKRVAVAAACAALAGCAGLDMPTPKEQSEIVAFCAVFWLPDTKENCAQIYTALPRSSREASMQEVANRYFDSNTCVRDGAPIATPAYAQCMATRKLIRAQEDANNRPAYTSAPTLPRGVGFDGQGRSCLGQFVPNPYGPPKLVCD